MASSYRTGRRGIVWVPSAALLLALGAACSSTPASTITVRAGDGPAGMWFEPREVTADPGRHTIVFRNEGALHHELAIIAASGETLAARSIAGGSTATFEVTLEEAGTYQLACREPGHTAAGMVGTLLVA